MLDRPGAPLLRVVPGLQDQPDPEKPPRHYGRVPCTDGVHEILISRITGRYTTGRQPRAFKALCGRIVRPIVSGADAVVADPCTDCPKARKAMKPAPSFWGDLREFALTLAAMLGGDSGSG
jgi:hypothetical protein